MLGCEYNMRTDMIIKMNVCKTAEKHGVFILHGNRGIFHKIKKKNKEPAFKAVYQAWEEVSVT